MYTCPHCGQPGLSFLRRAFLGPLIPASCVSCGKSIAIPLGRSLIAIAPFVLAILASALVPSIELELLLWVIGAVAMLVLFYRWVPLIRG